VRGRSRQHKGRYPKNLPDGASYTSGVAPTPETFVNGHLLHEPEAVISVFDHGLVTGDGVFESVLVHGGRTFALRRHLDRLERSAAIIGLVPPPRAEVEAAVGAVVTAARLERARVRITVTAGRGPLGSLRHATPPSLIVAIAPLETRPSAAGPGVDEVGTRVALFPWPRNERGLLAGAKTISYVENVVAANWAAEHNASEALFANLKGHLCEGTGSNVFVVHDGRLLTPPLSAGCLAGVTRALVLELTGASEADLELGKLTEVNEAFLTSTTRGVQPIASIDGVSLPASPGPVTREAMAAYDRLLCSTSEP
jgi:branched-chain amino acid aminotransferase